MGLLSGLRGPRREAIKRDVAQALDGVLVKTPPGHTVVVSDLDGWTVVYDINSPQEGPPPLFFGPRTVSRIGIPFKARDGFFWDLKRRRMVGDRIYDRRMAEGPSWEAVFEQIRPQLRTPDIEFGFGDFDYEFTHETNDEPRLRELLATPEIRGLIQEQPFVRLKVESIEGWLDSLVKELPADTGAVYFQDLAVIAHAGMIEDIHHLLRALVDRLIAIGSASPSPPRIFD